MSANRALQHIDQSATDLATVARLMKDAKASALPGKHQPNRESLSAIRKAVSHYKKCEWKEAAVAAAEAADHDARCATAFHLLGLALANLNQKHKAFEMYERALALDPTDSDLYLNIGTAAWDLKLYDGACKAFRAYIEMKPDCHKGYNNLAGCLRDKGEIDQAIDILRNALHLMPEAPLLWNTLGTIMGEQSDFENAVTFYKEARRLAPTMSRAYHNLGHALSHTGPLEEALENFDLALKYCDLDSDRAETLHARGVCLAAMGRLKEAWPDYEERLNPRCSQSIYFAVKAPRWEGEDLWAKKILFAGEQGLGDEIMLAGMVADLIERVGPDGTVMIACDHRLVPLYRRSFPNAHVGIEEHTRHNGTPVRLIRWAQGALQPDYYTPMGVPLKYLRNRIEDFPEHRTFLKPDLARVHHWQSRLASLGPGPYVGICWRSMLINTQRKKFYSALELWQPLLEKTEFKFINLQYGSCQDELDYMRDKFGIAVHNFQELDLKNNLDDNAALCAALDLVVSAPTAAAALAAGTGTETWFLTAGRVWPQLGTDHYPWYQNTRVYTPTQFGDWASLMQQVACEIDAKVSQ
ncbi:MAG: tetratricopeptide repeat protein [Micropepsaceae bacterium]